MNRRLHTPIIACSASALALAAGLVLAIPAASGIDPAAAPAPARTTAPAPERAVRGERGLVETGSEATPQRSRSKRARSAIAMPYFSFSRGAGGRS
ncbi:hypothetical protein LDO26_10640 [Luteimonas sp. BDR2-5]|uniref:hypothetical protein n=1 Tax=Proluteimonas luteida TaxID=2878685 RepID=UPI001E350D37|nr:hypothetical protein [Luteimonas sp. BDR2-5]MCD9028662.1 hypothetical protein [Luteimonas sp. BDR2-5]